MRTITYSLFLTLTWFMTSELGFAVNVSDFDPKFGSSTDPNYIYIYGSGFSAAGGGYNVSVYFNNVRDTSAYASSDTVIQAHVPAGAPLGSNPIRVQVGSSSVDSLADFTVIGPGPYISSFSPDTGGTGTEVTLSGGHLGTVTEVSFSGKVASIKSIGENSLTVWAPSGVISGPITAKSPQGTHTSAANFFVAPGLKGFTPWNGRVGTNVVITGTNFLGALGVTFNGVAAISYSVLSNGAIRATVPTNATTGKIRVNAPAGSTQSSSNFTVAPLITDFTPTFGPKGTSVTIFGANLNGANVAVKFNGVNALQVTNIGYGLLNAVVPDTTTGPITITNVDGSFTTATLFYLPPAITNISPNNSGPGTWVKVGGINLTNATAVSFGTVPAGTFVVSNNFTIGALVPPGIITAPMVVTTPGGQVTSTNLFFAPPVITGFVPTHGLPGTSVTVYGSNFLGTLFVKFNGTNATFIATNNNSLTATVPTGAQTGPITVIAPAGTNSLGDFVLDYTSDLALTASVQPNQLYAGNIQLYTLNITNRGPFPAPNLRWSSTIPAGAVLRGISAPGLLENTNGPLAGNLGTVDVDKGAQILFSVTPLVPGTISNFTAIAADYPDPVLTNNSKGLTSLVLPPLLSVGYSTNTVSLSWLAVLTNYTLESNRALESGTAWSNVTTSATSTNSLRVVSERATNAARFYRLRSN